MNEKKMVYISGQISGLARRTSRRRFLLAELWIRNNTDAAPVNPLRFAIPDLTYEQQMAIDIAVLKKCDAIFMLQGWENSPGAKREHDVAGKYEKEIIYQEDITEE